MSQKITDLLAVVVDQLFERDHHRRLYEDDEGFSCISSEYATGFHELDEHIVEIEPDTLTIISGHAGVGKSTFLLSLLDSFSSYLRRERGILYFNFESTAEQLILKYLACYLSIDIQQLRTARLSEDERHKLAHAKQYFDSMQLQICDNPSLTFEQLVDAIRDFSHAYPNSMIMIDDLQRIRPNIHTAYTYSRAETYSEMTRFLKQLARELGIRIVAVSQLTNDAALTRSNKRPILADLSAYGSLKDNADLIIFIYRDEMHYSRSKHAGIAEIIIAKHRYGPRAMLYLQFEPQKCRFRNLASKYLNPDQHEDYILH